VLTDIVMPSLHGIDMAEKILAIDPAVKILVMSGYSDRLLEVQARRKFPFIRKPFINAVLIEKIQSLIQLSDAAGSTT
jgi:FixJ family two-component response regulator